jgi:hypothetical protein
MTTAALVQARVVDIRDPKSPTPARLVADANVLFWVFYPNFAALQYAGGRLPLSYRARHYRAYRARAAKARTEFFTALATLGEFAKTAEYAELEAVWLTDPSKPQPDPAKPVTQFDPRVCKFARYHYAVQLPKIRGDVESMAAAVRKSVALLPQFPTSEDHQNAAAQEWRPSCGDLPDAALVALARRQGVADVLCDDMDLATFAGVTVYTANRRTIDAARAAGKLL